MQAWNWSEFGAGGLYIALEGQDLADEFAFLPKAEGIAIGKKDIRKRSELLALLLVMRGFELARVRTLARCLDFDESGERVADCNCIVRTQAKISK